MNLPTLAECEALFTKYHVPPNFLWHCQKVAEVGTFLALELQKKGIAVDVPFVQRACLLHDLFKFVTLKELKEQPEFKAPAPTAEQLASWKKLKQQFPDLYEGQIFHALFKDQWPELAEQLRIASDPYRVIALGKDRPWEERIQHYADCRVLGDQVVTLPHRFEDADRRYPHLYQSMGEKRAQEKEKIYEDEAEIFGIIGVSPDVLLEFNKNTTDLMIGAYNDSVDQYFERWKDYQDHLIYLPDLSLVPGKKILDIGCAFGRDSKVFHDKGMAITGIDASPNMIAKAKTLFPEITFAVKDMRKLDFPDNHFDYLFCNAALLHLKEQDVFPTLQGFYRILQEGGKLWLSVKEGGNAHYELRSGKLKFVTKFSKERIKQLLEHAGFEVLKLHPNKEKRKEGEISWINIIAQKPLKKEGGE